MVTVEWDFSCVEKDPVKRQRHIDNAFRIVFNAQKKAWLEEQERKEKERREKEFSE